MHLHLSKLLDTEVLGELVLKDGALWDDSRGRICLDKLDPVAIEALLQKLRVAYPNQLTVHDRLHWLAEAQPVRGLVEVEIAQPDAGPYLLEISHPSIFALYEQRFLIDPEQVGDLRGVLCEALYALVTQGAEHPLRLISGLDDFLVDYGTQLRLVLEGAQKGETVDSGPWIHDHAVDLARMWTLIPFPLRRDLKPLFGAPRAHAVPTDPTMRDAVFVAVNMVKGTTPSDYEQGSRNLGNFERTQETFVKIYSSVKETFVSPLYGVGMGRASSVERFTEAFPRYAKLVGPLTLEDNLHLG